MEVSASFSQSRRRPLNRASPWLIRLRIVPTTTAAISERRGTPGAMMHCQIACHRTTRTLLLLSRRSLHERAALRRHRSWLFAAYMLHVEDPRASGHAERAEPPPRFGDDAC